MNKVKFGLKGVVIAIPTYDGSDITYAAIVSIPGAVTLSLDKVGDINEFYADDILYYADSNNDGYSGTIEFAQVTDDILTAVLGMIADTDGAIFEYANTKSVDVAIGFEIDGDNSGRKVWLYRCAITRPNESSATKSGGNEPQTETFDIRAYGRETDNLVRSKIELNATNAAVFNAYLDEPAEVAVA